jgi:hypothetical protein
MIRTALGCLGLFSLSSCWDADGDHLASREEKRAGTDPRSVDSDGDGLHDGEEQLFLGTDPTRADSDGDGVDDGTEVDLGLDPLDSGSSGYELGWPQAPAVFKDALSEDTLPAVLEVGSRVPRTWLLDAANQSVDLYDFAGHGRPVLLLAIADTLVEVAELYVELGEVNAPNTAGLSTYQAYAEGAVDVVPIITSRFDGDLQGYAPPSLVYSESGCVGETLRCLVDVQFSLWNYLRQPEYPNLWLLLDDTLVVHAIGDPEIPGTFDELDARLELMLADDGG